MIMLTDRAAAYLLMIHHIGSLVSAGGGLDARVRACGILQLARLPEIILALTQ